MSSIGEGCVKTSQGTGFGRNTLWPVKVTVFQKKSSIKSSKKKVLLWCQAQRQSVWLAQPVFLSTWLCRFLVSFQRSFCLHNMLRGHSEHKRSIIQLYIHIILNFPAMSKFHLTLNVSSCVILCDIIDCDIPRDSLMKDVVYSLMCSYTGAAQSSSFLFKTD